MHRKSQKGRKRKMSINERGRQGLGNKPHGRIVVKSGPERGLEKGSGSGAKKKFWLNVKLVRGRNLRKLGCKSNKSKKPGALEKVREIARKCQKGLREGLATNVTENP